MACISAPADGSPDRLSDVLDPVSDGVTPGAGRPAHRGPNPGGAAAYDGARAFKYKDNNFTELNVKCESLEVSDTVHR